MNQAADVVDAPDAGDARRTPSPPPRWHRALRFLPALAAVLATVWVFRTVLRGGLLPGNIGDARWTIALHEHWYRVWSGQDAIRDLHYYFPLANTLGSSDAFLVQGQIYSLARLVGFSQINSWVIAGFTFFLIGALGVAVLARQLLDSRSAQVAMVVLSVASYPVLVGLGHVQLFGLLSVSWMFVGLHDVISRRHVRRGVALLVAVPPLLGLSSWYALVLGAVVIGFLGLALLLVSSWAGIVRMVRQVAGDLWDTLRSIPGAVLAVLFVLLWAGVLWVYLPSRGLLPKPGWQDVVAYGPRWSDIWNASDGGGGIWRGLYARLPELGQSNYEQQRGFTPILLIAFAVVTFAVFRSVVLARRVGGSGPVGSPAGAAADGAADALVGAGGDRAAGPRGVGRAGLLAAALTVAAVIGFVLIDERGLSFYRIAWDYVPGMEAVRAPFRVMTILYGVAFFVVFRGLELAWQRSTWLRRVPWRRTAFAAGAALLAVLLFVEMQRDVDTHWTRAELLSPGLLAQIEPARQSCDAVILLNEDPAGAVWKNPIEAVVFATLSGLPTPQGYSRADPVDYPGQVGDTDGTPLAQWMRAGGFDGRICTVSTQGVRVLQG
jgi:hypothetical protein